MKKCRLFPFLLCLTLIALSCKSYGSNPESVLTLADPTIFQHKGTYYLYGTSSNQGFEVYTSKDLKSWEGPCGARDGFALKKGDSYGTKGFWAPQIFEHKGLFYMAYTADEHIAIATSKSPLGPFAQTTPRCISGSTKQIDPFVYFDTDGKIYLYYVRLLNGNNIYVSPLKEDLSDIDTTSITLCIKAEKPWENTQNATWPVTEGPTILKKDKQYYLFYSANDYRNIDYAVGFATSDSPLGPWKKTEEVPFIHRKLMGRNGTGHGDFFTDKKGQLQYVLHLHRSDSEVSPRVTGIVECDFVRNTDGTWRMEADSDSFRYLEKSVKKSPKN